jgi:hypothetical protein
VSVKFWLWVVSVWGLREVQGDGAPERGQVRRAGERGAVQRGVDGLGQVGLDLLPQCFGGLAVDRDEVVDVADAVRAGEFCLAGGDVELRQDPSMRWDVFDVPAEDSLGDEVLAPDR